MQRERERKYSIINKNITIKVNFEVNESKYFDS